MQKKDNVFEALSFWQSFPKKVKPSMKLNIKSIRITIHYLVLIFSLSSCMSNKTENGILTSVKLSEEHFGEMVTSESAEGIDTLIYIEVYVNNDSVISWQSPEINIGIDIQLGNNSDGNNKLYSVSYHELDKILTDKFVIQFNEQTNRYLNHGKLHLLQVGRSSTSSFSLINTEKGWQSLTNDYLDGLVRFENVIRDRKRLDFNKKIIHRSYKYIGDEVEVVTHELIED